MCRLIIAWTAPFAMRCALSRMPISSRAASTGGSDDLRARMLRLLSSDSPAAIRGYLSLVRNDATRFAAFAAAKDSRNFPTEAFIALLDDKDESVRIAAALVLGHVNGPE